VDLVHRNRLDRAVSTFYKVHRYACSDEACGWQGLLHSTHHRPRMNVKRIVLWIGAAVILVSAAAAIALLIYVEAGPLWNFIVEIL
jgi:hypothetical protein